MDLEKYFKDLCFDPKFHLGLGDIRLTPAMQEEIIREFKKLEEEIVRLEIRLEEAF